MSGRYPFRSRLRRRSSLGARYHEQGAPKFDTGSTIGDFTVLLYLGHSDVNKRNNHIMAKPQHWYRCRCSCGVDENRSQQELTDIRRSQCCYECRAKKGELDEDPS